MSMDVGVWIDHRKAVLVTVSEKGVDIGLTISAVERQARRTGSSPLKGKFDDFQAPASDVRKRTFQQHLNVYYDAVIASVAQADNLLVCGPGEAKLELRKRLKKRGLDGKVAAVKTLDKMTDRQLAVWVRQYFGT